MVKGIIAYMENAIGKSSGEQRQAYLQEYSGFQRHASQEIRTKAPGAAARAYAPRLSRKARADRYNDLFEELMRYMDEDEIVSEADYREALESVMAPRIERREGQAPMTRENLTNLFEELVKTSGAARLFEKAEKLPDVPEITQKTMERYVEHVKPGRRAVYYNRVAFKTEVRRIIDSEKRTVQIIYKTTLRGRPIWRDINTERFAKNPYIKRE